MSREIRINPDISSIPYGDRKKILDAAQKRKDLADLASGNPDMPIPQFIRDRVKEALDQGYARYTNYYGIPELRQKLVITTIKQLASAIQPLHIYLTGKELHRRATTFGVLRRSAI